MDCQACLHPSVTCLAEPPLVSPCLDIGNSRKLSREVLTTSKTPPGLSSGFSHPNGCCGPNQPIFPTLLSQPNSDRHMRAVAVRWPACYTDLTMTAALGTYASHNCQLDCFTFSIIITLVLLIIRKWANQVLGQHKAASINNKKKNGLHSPIGEAGERLREDVSNEIILVAM